MKRLLFAFFVLALPAFAFAEGKTHIETDGRECGECHIDQARAWYDGKHGVMNVKCVVCHGSPEENFTANPGVSRCMGCHGEQVDQAMMKKSKSGSACFSCHDNHLLTVKTPFHTKGGGQP
jgi:hypothetical protein